MSVPTVIWHTLGWRYYASVSYSTLVCLTQLSSSRPYKPESALEPTSDRRRRRRLYQHAQDLATEKDIIATQQPLVSVHDRKREKAYRANLPNRALPCECVCLPFFSRPVSLYVSSATFCPFFSPGAFLFHARGCPECTHCDAPASFLQNTARETGIRREQALSQTGYPFTSETRHRQSAFRGKKTNPEKIAPSSLSLRHA